MPEYVRQWFYVDYLAGFTAVCVAVFFVLTLIYSWGFMRGRPGLFRYYLYLAVTCAGSIGAVLADNLVLFACLWGFLGLTLYLLINFEGTNDASQAAKKAFIIVGGTDAFMLFGLAILWRLAGRPGLAAFSMQSVRLTLNNPEAILAYLCLAAAAFAKAGAIPFHTWVPPTADHASTPVAAYLPASLDKLLGIYFLARLSLDLFVMTPAMNTLLMALGSLTIFAAVMMALVQHRMKRLLGYHAVSQVGYMVLGIGTGTPLGIAGGLFHMLNNTIYKSCLFLTAGAVEKQTGSTELDRLGGCAKTMPITFTSFLIAALAISGVPPLNGFASKWMVYQAVIDTSRTGGGLWVVWLLAAMLGSALTLASFMKLVHAVFLGSAEATAAKPGPIREVGASMWGPAAILAGICLVFGIWPYALPIKWLIQPSIEMDIGYTGLWHPAAATVLLAAALLLGVVIYLANIRTNTRTVAPFVGGEVLDQHPEMRLSGVDFYGTVQNLPVLSSAYRLADQGAFDIYTVGTKVTFGFSRVLGALHDGRLPRYLAWCLLGALVLLYLMMRWSL